eukprot:2791033-Amphidinium_carterae.2
MLEQGMILVHTILHARCFSELNLADRTGFGHVSGTPLKAAIWTISALSFAPSLGKQDTHALVAS